MVYIKQETGVIMKYAIRLTLFTILIYSIMSYWGVRSPDSEIVFRTTEALSTKGTFAVSNKLVWKGFGLSKGQDGKLYSIFGPVEAIAAVPLYKLAEAINSTGWYKDSKILVSKSHYVNDGLSDFVMGDTPKNLEGHSLRMVVSLLNIIFGTLCVFLFYFIVKAITQSEQSALFTSILFAFGTLIFPYSGMFFSELIATFFAMLSLYLLIYNGDYKKLHNGLFLITSGISLGLAAATHITAMLFVPFFLIYAALSSKKYSASSLKNFLINGSLYTVGFGLIIILLAYYNLARFGSIIETGRGVSDTTVFLGYGTFVAPWRGLWGLLIGAGKGLFLFCPAIILSIVAWIPFHKKHPLLSFMIIGAVLLRIIFIASRSDWHGGFSLGPRYLVMIIPFLLLPLGEFLKEMMKHRYIKVIFTFALFSLICTAQQIYFALGEIFTFLHIIKLDSLNSGVNPFENDQIYLSWKVSPLLYLLNGFRGPLLLNSITFGNYILWLFLILVAALFFFFLYFFVLIDALPKRNVADDDILKS